MRATSSRGPRRIRRGSPQVDRPEIWITCGRRRTCWPRPRRSTPRRGRGACRWPAARSRSRTTSTSPGCRRRPAARRIAYAPRRRRHRGRAAARGRRRRARQDQPRPVRHWAGRHPQPVRRGAATPGTRAACPADRARARRSPWRSGSRHRARHRHRRLRTGAGRVQRHRRRQADAGPRSRRPASCQPAAASTA